MSRFGQVGAPWWDDRPLIIIGGGPSLRGRDLSRIHERGRILGVNRVADYIRVDATFSLDRNFISQREDDLAKWALEHEVFLAQGEDESVPLIRGATYIRRFQGEGLSDDPRFVINGLNSGYSAINLAVLKRAREIYLLGYDLHHTNGTTHWHDGYTWNSGMSEKYYSRWAEKFDNIPICLPDGVKIVNANPESAVRAFPFTTYEEMGL